MKKQTRIQYALKLLAKGKPLSCQQISKAIIKKEKLTGNTALYLSGSMSSKLANLVKKGTLIYADGEAEKGGHLYRINNLPY